MEVIVKRRETYGTMRFYPDNDRAVVVAALLRKKTIDYSELLLVKELGFNVKITGDVEVVL